MGNNFLKKCCDIPKDELVITRNGLKPSRNPLNEADTNHSENSLGVNNQRKIFGRKDFLGTPTHSKFLSHQKVKDDFEIVRELGKGAYGEVKLARNKKTGVLEVIKKINIAPFDTKNEEFTKNEIEMLI
jgi:hypothetical protein